MDTEQNLQNIEPADFETLATGYLRNTKPELRGLIHTGVNDKGAPIKCRVDGVLFIHGKPDYCVQVAYTKTEGDLRRKWLGGPKGKQHEIGDIAKAHEEFKLWRNSHPTAKHKLYLATKNHLANDIGLYRDAIAKGASLDIEVEIVEGSLLIPSMAITKCWPLSAKRARARRLGKRRTGFFLCGRASNTGGHVLRNNSRPTLADYGRSVRRPAALRVVDLLCPLPTSAYVNQSRRAN
ncbi:MAG: hypothetical protein ACREAB_02835 [Blastocatellia bacterium]